MTNKRKVVATDDLKGRIFPQIVTILPTYRCTAACENCCFESSPKVSGRIPPDRMIKYIDEAANIDTVRLLVISGGEPFLLGNHLYEIIEHATSVGLCTRVVTNGYWATSPEKATSVLLRLSSAGLKELNFSTGDFHAAFVPLERITHGARAAVDQGMTVVIMVERHAGRKVLADDLKSHPALKEIFADSKRSGLLAIVESPWMARGETTQGINRRSVEAGKSVPHEPQTLLTRENLNSRRGCTSVLNTLTVTPYERVGACCGLPREEIPELDVGSALEQGLAACYEAARNDFLKIWLAVEGPERILAWAAEHDTTIEWENLYSHQCDACRAVYKDPKVAAVIGTHYREKLSDVVLQFAALDRGGSSRSEGDKSIKSGLCRA